MLLEAGWSSNLEYYTNSYRDGVGKQRGTPAWFAGASRLEAADSAAASGGDVAKTRRAPSAQNVQASVSYVTGSHNIKFGVQYQWGDFLHTRQRECGPHAAVPQPRRHAGVLRARLRHHPQHAARSTASA